MVPDFEKTPTARRETNSRLSRADFPGPQKPQDTTLYASRAFAKRRFITFCQWRGQPAALSCPPPQNTHTQTLSRFLFMKKTDSDDVHAWRRKRRHTAAPTQLAHARVLRER